jgi:hypothetical protein
VGANTNKDIFTNPASQQSVEDTITARPTLRVSWLSLGAVWGMSVFATLDKDVMIISYMRNVMDAAPPNFVKRCKCIPVRASFEGLLQVVHQNLEEPLSYLLNGNGYYYFRVRSQPIWYTFSGP